MYVSNETGLKNDEEIENSKAQHKTLKAFEKDVSVKPLLTDIERLV